MSQEETEYQKTIREKSEKENPYSQECPNRHLWSEGYRSAKSKNCECGDKSRGPEKGYCGNCGNYILKANLNPPKRCSCLRFIPCEKNDCLLKK